MTRREFIIATATLLVFAIAYDAIINDGHPAGAGNDDDGKEPP